MRLKKLRDQVVVVTGASSGIGLATARLAAERGAKVVMVARSAEGLGEAADSIRGTGGDVTHFVADVADETAVIAAAEHAVQTFGRIDTWVNNAGIGMYGRVEQLSTEDMRRLFDVTFWGVVYGSRAALPYLRQNGGALVNVGSVESDVTLPLSGLYAAAKHAVKAFTHSLRMELEKEGVSVAVTLVKPGSIDTPFFEHAKNYMEGEPKPPPPVYAPETVARAILESAERPLRDIVVGGAGRMQVGMERLMPRASEKVAQATMFRGQQQKRRGMRDPEGALYRPRGTHAVDRGGYRGHVVRRSAYTHATLHPVQTVAIAVSLGAAVLGLFRWLRTSVSHGPREHAFTQ